MYAAAENGRDPVVTPLFDRGAKVDAASRRGETPLVAAASGGFESTTAALLLARGADPDRGTEEGDPLLAMAVRRGLHGLVADLLSHGANPDVSWEGRTLDVRKR